MNYGRRNRLLLACAAVAALLPACVAPIQQKGFDSLAELAEAAGRGNAAEVDRLVAAGASLDEPIVLKEAVRHRQYAMIRQLVAQGAPVNGDGTQTSPLWSAVSLGDIHMTELLIDLGADVNWQTGQKGTPLHAAARGGPANEHRVALAELLLEHGAWIDAMQDDPALRAECLATALHAAVGGPDAPMVRFLLARGASTSAVDAQGRTPADCARQYLQQAPTDEARLELERVIALLEAPRE